MLSHSFKYLLNFAAVNIFLTYDYELFFGEDTGSVEKCLIEPTDRLLELSKRYSCKMTFFVDVGYLIKLEEFAKQFPELNKDSQVVKDQILRMISAGNDVQLHIHPHWERSFYQEGKWVVNTDGAYKLSDFSDDEITSIVTRYKQYLDQLIGRKTSTFRAGGWCIQPFIRVEKVFKELDLIYDSSVFPGGKFSSPHYDFDFTKAPKKARYRFDTDVCAEQTNGYFTEFPISSWRYSPLFYWRLYILGRLFPSRHKMLGDGKFLSQPGRKTSVLTNFTWNHVSTDGFYVSKLNTCVRSFDDRSFSDMVVIGHPKSMTVYSFEKLEKFMNRWNNKHSFITFRDLD
jgi:peptidoglycan/xylan/chitin deacetylase (PgdA/CDA1 family)